MNEKFTDNTELANKLNHVSEQTHVDPYFMNELEQKLKTAYKPKTTWWTPSKNSILPSLGWVVMVLAAAWLLSWTIQNLIPTVQPASDITPTAQVFNNTPAYTITPQADATPILESGEYDWRSTKLNLNQPLPQSPTEANVYLLNLKQPVTREDVLALAQRFALQGEVQELPPDFSIGIGYMLTDGTQKLEVQSNNHFVFYPNPTAPALGAVPKEQAQIAIDGFLKKYGFNFEYRLESAPGLSAQQYVILPLTPDGAEIRTDYLMPISYEFTIDGSGQVLAFSGFLLDYETLGTFQLITAEEAFQSVLNDNPQFGRMESIRGNGGGGGGGPGFYKLNLSGTPVPFPSAIQQQSGFQGNTEYIVLENDTIASIAANFGVSIDELAQANNLSNENLIFVGQKLIIPGAQQNSTGYAYTVVAGDTCLSIAYTFNVPMSELTALNNLPDDCSTLTIDQVLTIPVAQPLSDSPYIGKRFEDQRGIFMVNLYRRPDGGLRKEYGFVSIKNDEIYNLKLEGTGLQDIEQYHNLPINIWATITSVDQFGAMTANLERFVIPFPDLRIQIFQGQQKVTQIDGKSAVLFTTTDGKTYIQAILDGDPFNDDSLIGHEGDQVLLEGFNIPDEFNSGYPVLRIFGGSLVTSNDSQATEMTVTADQPNIYDEIPNAEGLIPPTATIEKVELVYYVPNPLYGNARQTADGQTIQPVWRFHGHYSTGDEFEILIQALKQDFLLPQLAPYTPPG
jgi:LysM repeat protein